MLPESSDISQPVIRLGKSGMSARTVRSHRQCPLKRCERRLRLVQIKIVHTETTPVFGPATQSNETLQLADGRLELALFHCGVGKDGQGAGAHFGRSVVR